MAYASSGDKLEYEGVELLLLLLLSAGVDCWDR